MGGSELHAGDSEPHVGLVVYGDLGTTSGGYLYDRKLVAYLREAGECVTVVSLPDPPSERSPLRALADNLDPRIGRRLRGFDVLVADELCHSSLVAHVRRADAPVVALVHHLRASESRSEWRRRAYRAVERAFLRGADAAVYASETTRRDAERLAGARPAIVARPAGDRFEPFSDFDPAEISARAERDPFRVAFVGNLVARKGLHDLLDGLARVESDWRLSVVGGPTESEYARRMRARTHRLGVADAVTFEGRLPDDALADRLAESHLLAVPSTYEGYGIVYLEGMGFGLPALATTAGGATELVSDGENGVLVPPGDPAAISEAVERLAADRERLAELGRAARRRYERHPGWDETMACVREFLLAISEGRARPAEVLA